MKRYSLIVITLSIFFVSLYMNAQTSGPTAPEVMKFEPVDNTDLVNLFTGDVVYTLPVIQIPGPEGDFSMALSYHSGIHPHEEASWVGLGFGLQPGSISRNVRGFPDDYLDGNVVSHFNGPDYYGFSVSVGDKLVGGTLNWRNNEGFGGSVGLNIPLSKTSPFIFTPRIGTEGISLGMQTQIKNNVRGVGIAASSGASISSKGDVGYGSGIGIEGGSFSMSANPGYSSFSISLPIPKTPVIVGGFHAWLNEDVTEHAYGYMYPYELWQQAPGGKYNNWKNWKSEYYRSGKPTHFVSGFMEPSQDSYSVNAQGLSGQIIPQNSVYFDVLPNDFWANFWQLGQFNAEGDWDGEFGEIFFRFIGDIGGKQVPDISYDPDHSPTSEFDPGDPSQVHSRKVQYIIDNDPNSDTYGKALVGFKITERDGMVYEFLQPVYNYDQASYGVSSEDPNFYNSSHFHTKFAYTWLLTGIKGPDYIDYNSNSEIDDEDFGYWVKFIYELKSDEYKWRVPYSGTSKSSIQTEDDLEEIRLDRSYSRGLKQLYYLNNIETATHIAYFEIKAREDAIAYDPTIFPNPIIFDAKDRMRYLDQIQLYRKTDWNDANNDGIVADNEVDVAKSIRSTRFNYDYSLSRGMPNSDPDNDDPGDLDSDGKLTLKTVTFYGKGATTAMPSYEFAYYKNPNYDFDKFDRWGYYKSDGTDGEHLVSDVSAVDVDAWSLNQIKTPLGGIINIEYESDSYQHVRNQTVKTLQPILQFEPANIMNGVIIALPENYRATRDLIGQTISLFGQKLDLTDTYGPHSLEIVDVGKVNGEYRIQMESLNVGDPRQLPEWMKGEKSVCCIREVTASNHLYEYVDTDQKYGGGIRVKSIMVSDGTHPGQRTEYFYDINGDGSGASSGVATNEPPPHMYEVFDDRIDTFKQEKFGNSVAPGPSVGYQKVIIVNSDANGNNAIGKTEYLFYTAFDFPFEFLTEENNGYEFSYLTIDYVSIYGKLKKQTIYDHSGAIKKSTDHLYQFSNGLLSDHSNAGNTLNGIDILNSDYSADVDKMGMMYHRFGRGMEMGGAHYNVNSAQVRYNALLKEVTETNDDVSVTTHNDFYDFHSGLVLQSHSQNSLGESIHTRKTPAYWKYSGMETKNMLTQEFMSEVFLNSVTNDNLLAATVTTWSNEFDLDGGGTTGTWLKNDTYVYNKQLDLSSGSGYSVFPNSYIDDTGDDYPTVHKDAPWKKTTNITKYDRYSHPIESVAEDGSYSATVYGHNNALPVTIATKASQSEIYYTSYEDGIDDWSPSSNNIEVESGSPVNGDTRSGAQSIKVNHDVVNSSGHITVGVLEGGKAYQASVWFKCASGLQGKLFFGDANGAYGNPYENSVYKIVDGNGEWQLITVQKTLSQTEQMEVYLYCLAGTGYVLYDDLRVHPIDSHMITYTYDPLTWQITSITDANNTTQYYEYDELGRLTLVRDHDSNILKHHQYVYGRND